MERRSTSEFESRNREARSAPHIMLLHVMGIRPFFDMEESEVPVYAWDLDTISGQTTLYILVCLSWIMVDKYQVTMTKVVAVDQYLSYEYPVAACIALETVTTTKKLRAPMAVYIPQCSILTLLTGMRSPCISWRIFQYHSKK